MCHDSPFLIPVFLLLLVYVSLVSDEIISISSATSSLLFFGLNNLPNLCTNSLLLPVPLSIIPVFASGISVPSSRTLVVVIILYLPFLNPSNISFLSSFFVLCVITGIKNRFEIVYASLVCMVNIIIFLLFRSFSFNIFSTSKILALLFKAISKASFLSNNAFLNLLLLDERITNFSNLIG